MSAESKKYELVYIADPERTDEQLGEIGKALKTLIENEGGKVEHIEQWGKKRLAYQVKKQRYGYYTLFHYTAMPKIVAMVELALKHHEHVLKYITFNHDPRSALKLTSMDSTSYYNTNRGDQRY